MSKWANYRYALLPGLTITIGSLLVAYVLGGPIAAALAGFVSVGGFLISSVGCLLVFALPPDFGKARSLVLGTGLFVLAAASVVGLFSLSGQSQLM